MVSVGGLMGCGQCWWADGLVSVGEVMGCGQCWWGDGLWSVLVDSAQCWWVSCVQHGVGFMCSGCLVCCGLQV